MHVRNIANLQRDCINGIDTTKYKGPTDATTLGMSFNLEANSHLVYTCPHPLLRILYRAGFHRYVFLPSSGNECTCLLLHGVLF